VTTRHEEGAGSAGPAEARRAPGGAAATPSDPVEEGSELTTDLGLLALVLIWGVNFSVIKVALQEMHPLVFNALRFPLAALALYAMVRSRPGPRVRLERGDRAHLVGLGILGNVAYQLVFIYGIDATLAGNAAVLLATTPVWIILLSTVLGHESPPGGVWLGVLATVAGMVLVVLGGPRRVALGGETLAGDLLMISASVIWSVYTVGGRNLTRKYGSLRVTAWTIWVGTPALVVLAIPYAGDLALAEISPLAWGSVAYAGVLAIAVAYFLWYHGVRRLGSSRTAIYSNLVPVVALVTAWIWLGERPGALQLVGAAVVIGGLTLARGVRRRGGAWPNPAPE